MPRRIAAAAIAIAALLGTGGMVAAGAATSGTVAAAPQSTPSGWYHL